MSRVGKAPIALPKGAEVNFAGGLLTVKGPLGTLTQPIHHWSRSTPTTARSRSSRQMSRVKPMRCKVRCAP